jgi:hypothetical protein
LVKLCPFAHTRNRLWERRDGAPQLPHGTFASNPSVFLAATVVTALSAGFLPISLLRIRFASSHGARDAKSVIAGAQLTQML